MMRWHGLLLTALACTTSTYGRSISVKLWAPWPTTVWSPIAEACEFVSEYGADVYWEYVERVAGLELGDFEDGVEKATEVALEVAADLGVSAGLRAALATREFAARVEAHRNTAPNVECTGMAFVLIDDRVACAVADILIEGGRPPLFDSPALGSRGVEAELFVRGFGQEFAAWLQALKRLALSEKRLKVRLRWSLRGPSIDRTYLQGFGVNLDIKNLEYKNWDDTEVNATSSKRETSFEDREIEGMNFARLYERRPELGRELSALRDALLDSATDSTQLKMWKVRDLALQASLEIVSAKDPLRKLMQISQDVPAHASSLSSVRVSDQARAAARKQMRAAAQQRLPLGGATLYVGGVAYSLDSPTFSIHLLMRAVRAEMRFHRTPYAAKIAEMETDLRSLEAPRPPQRVDVLTGSKGAVAYLNNLEKDELYKRWPATVQQLLYPSWQLHAIAKNIYTCLLILDLASMEAMEAINVVGLMLDKGYPIRFGIAILADSQPPEHLDDPARFSLNEEADNEPIAKPLSELVLTETGKLAAIFGAAKAARGPKTAFMLLRRLADEDENASTSPEDKYASIVGSRKEWYGEKKNPELELGSAAQAKQQFMDQVIKGDAQGPLRSAVEEFIVSSQKFASSKNLVSNCFVLNGRVRPGLASLQNEIFPMLGEEQQYVTDLVARGHVTDRTKSIYGKTILGDGSTKPPQRFSSNSERLVAVWQKAATQDEQDNVVFQKDFAVEDWLPSLSEEAPQDGLLSVAAVCDFRTRRGVGLARLALDLLQSENRVARLTVVSSAPREDATAVARYQELVPRSAHFLDGEEGANYLLVNGRRVESPKGTEPLELEEIRTLVIPYEARVARVLIDDVLEGVVDFDTLTQVRCLAGERLKEPRDSGTFAMKALAISPFVALEQQQTQSVPVLAVMDPLTEGAQRGSSVLIALRDALGVTVSLVLTPTADLSELPLQKYYRFAVDAVTPDYAGYSSGCEFASLPRSQVLTLRVDTPEAWDVQTAVANQDLDNLRQGEDDDLIEYQLKSLVVAGQCYDLRERRPPNGLQVELAPLGADTLVMQNLGYFQLRGMPGAFTIRLKPETRSSELYDVLEPPLYAEVTDGIAVLVNDLDGGATQLRVRKKPQFKHLDLLDKDDDSQANVAVEPDSSSSFLNRWFSSTDAPALATNETVHVFSLATGSLYERFLKIMMLSVRKRTTGRVKFWLFENYLTPSFKRDAAALAEARDFLVDYVTYKWPQWLRRQTVKQRIIWGYKILFLDVLFPLDVPKIIYVDADQVVRGDLRELWQLDLKGRPYGYTPFCDSRPETLGFQFWRSGYWADHLRGRPYHISALYVVDLIKFRQMAVGDQLRAVYDQLSRDPNSLANLDQDLPNYAQHSIPIYSLPQEWLWCESWCSDESKSKAKTIDLCNNPLHKENKLAMAKRIINGSYFKESWDQLDEEVKLIASQADRTS